MSMIVANFHPKRAPNPACCSDPGVLCASCAMEAMGQASSANQLTLNRQHRRVQPLTTPLTFNVQESNGERKEDCKCSRQAASRPLANSESRRKKYDGIGFPPGHPLAAR